MAEEMKSAYTGARDVQTSQEIEAAARLRSYIPLWLEELDLGCDMDDLRQYLLREDADVNHLGLASRKRETLIKQYKPFGEATRKAAMRFCKSFDECGAFKATLRDIILPRLLLNEMMEAARKRPASAVSRIETYTSLTCVVCAAIDCPTHGDYTHERVNDTDEEDDVNDPEMKFEHHPLVLGYEDSLRKHRNRVAKVQDEPDIGSETPKPCTSDCYLMNDFSEREYEMSEKNLSHITQMLLVYKNPRYRACLIAFALGIPCWVAYAEIGRIEEEGLPEEEKEVVMGRPKKPSWYDNKRKLIQGDLDDVTEAHLHQNRSQPALVGPLR